MLLKVTPVVDSDIKVLYLNADKVLGIVEYELDDGPIAAVVLGVNEAGELESMPVTESIEELQEQMERV